MIGDWCRAYQRNCTEILVDYSKFSDIPYWVRDEASLNNSWPQEHNDSWKMIVAEDLGISVGELEKHITQLTNYTGPISGLPVLNTSVDLTPKLTVALDGEIHAGPSTNKDGLNNPSDQPASGGDSKSLPKPRGSANKPGRAQRSNRQRDANVRDQRECSDKQARKPDPTPTNTGGQRPNKPDGRRSAPQVKGKKLAKTK